MMWGFDANVILLKMWLSLRIFSTTLELIGLPVFSWRYGKPIIFKYDFDWGSLGESTSLELIQFVPLTYCSIDCKSNEAATLLVITIIPAVSEQMKSTVMTQSP